MEPADPPIDPALPPGKRKEAAALKAAMGQIRAPSDAEQTLDKLGMPAKAPAAGVSPAPNGTAEARTEQSAETLVETAEKIAEAGPEEKAKFDPVIEDVSGGHQDAKAPEAPAQRGVKLLREALLRRLKPIDALDAAAFVKVNQLPHPPGVDRFMNRVTWVMTGGFGWALVLLILTAFDRKRGLRAMAGILPSLWVATSTVEYPVKAVFRRRRPFLDVVGAIIVGRKPGSFSFPSGHSAAAFAGARLLSIYYPRWRWIFRLIAGLTGFSRVYVGAHYPGDVLTGAAAGSALATIYHRLFTSKRQRRRLPRS